jgi:hypothetical protein
VRATRITGGLGVLVVSGAIAWDFTNDRFWSHHALLTSLVASFIAVAVTAAVLNEVLERRLRERWSVVAQYALLDLVRTARLVWSGLLELAGLVPNDEVGDEALAADSEAVRDRPRLAAAIDEMLANPKGREQAPPPARLAAPTPARLSGHTAICTTTRGDTPPFAPQQRGTHSTH